MNQEIPEAIKSVGYLIDAWLPLKLQYDKTPGTSIGIVYKGKLLYKNGFGFADVKTKKKALPNTLYHIASISKVFTAVAVLQLVEKGLLNLDDTVVKHLPWFKGKTKKTDSKNITLRQILSHTSGIFRDGDTPHWVTGKFPTSLQKSFSQKSLSQENLTGFKYSNYGFSLLGQVLEKVTGEFYDQYIQKNIFKALGMESTFTDYSEGLKNIAAGYGREIPREKREVFPHYRTNAYAPATGFLSTVADLAKFVSALSLDSAAKHRLLGRELKKQMMHPYEKTGRGEDKYGLGIETFSLGKRKVLSHSGGFQGFITQIMFDPENNLGVVVLSNALGSSAPALAQGILEALYETVDAPIKQSGAKKVSFKKYEGAYRNIWGDTVITKIGNTLVGLSLHSNSPLKQKTVLKPTGKAHCFIMETENGFDSRGEIALFTDFRNGKAQKVIFGATPSKRVAVKI